MCSFLHKDESRIIRQLSDFLHSTFGVTTRVQSDARHDGVTVRVTKSQRLVDFLLAVVGEYSSRKHLLGARYGSREFHAGMAHGYVDGDGYVKYDGAGNPVSTTVKTVSERLARQFYWLLVSYGFTPVVFFTPAYSRVESGREVVRQATYTIKLSGVQQMRKFRFWGKSV